MLFWSLFLIVIEFDSYQMGGGGVAEFSVTISFSGGRGVADLEVDII